MISSLPGGRTLAAVKGAPETIKGMLKDCPKWYDETYKWYTRRGSRVLALGAKDMEAMNVDKVRGYVPLFVLSEAYVSRQINKMSRELVESNLVFAGFLVFHCPLKADAINALKMLADSSHRVSTLSLWGIVRLFTMVCSAL
jgi:cation-transporting ATPase 13A1